jgi:hypothetical protein
MSCLPNDLNRRSAARAIAVAAAIEAITGLVLISFPSVFVRLLLGAELSYAGQALGRLAGVALLALVLACWPGAGAESRPTSALRALLAFSVLTAIYLTYLGSGSRFAGPLLWPAVILHSVVAISLARAWLKNSRSGRAAG